MQSVEKKILDHAGPVVNMRTFRNKFNANSHPTKEETEQAVVKLQDEGFGKFVKSGNTAAFLKQLPSAVDEGKLQFYMSKMSYKDVFCRKNFDLAKQQVKGSPWGFHTRISARAAGKYKGIINFPLYSPA